MLFARKASKHFGGEFIELKNREIFTTAKCLFKPEIYDLQNKIQKSI
jgi:hypothetical protein